MQRFVVTMVAALIGVLAVPGRAQDEAVSPLVEISRPNSVGSCLKAFTDSEFITGSSTHEFREEGEQNLEI